MTIFFFMVLFAAFLFFLWYTDRLEGVQAWFIGAVGTVLAGWDEVWAAISGWF